LSEPTPNRLIDICESVTGSVSQQRCLHLCLENGNFQELPPQPKAFGGNQTPQTTSLSALFDQQQRLSTSRSVLSVKGRLVLAVALASALLPFLETPWLQLSLDSSMIQFFEPREDGELPDITKPFLALKHIPVQPGHRRDSKNSPAVLRHAFHPNPSVLALGVLLCELHYCTPLKLMANESNVDPYYTCSDRLNDMKSDAGEDYSLATNACLDWKYLPPGHTSGFGDLDVQRLFYEKVVKRLEAAMTKQWGLQLENFDSFDTQQNASCWGPIGRKIVSRRTSETEASGAGLSIQTNPHRSMSETAPVHHNFLPNVALRATDTRSSGSSAHKNVIVPSERSHYFFDARLQTSPEQG
jgi:hypothetical protein